MATWRMLVEQLVTGDATGLRVYQKIIPHSDVILSACRAKIVQFNNPTWTAINMRIYSDNGSGAPRALIATSNSIAKASVFSLAYGMKEVSFLFSPNLTLKGTDSYHFVLGITGYTGDDTAYLGWKKAYPDPVYQTNVNMTYEGGLISPYDLVLIGAAL